MAERKRKDRTITPDLQKRLEQIVADSPLNDEPLTPEQEERLAQSLKQMKAELENVDEEQLIAEIRASRPRPN